MANGYAEGIALDDSGHVSEGSGENIFVVRDGKIVTPPLGASVLPGITRDTILTLARDMNIPIVEQIIPRELLYIADEVFFCGTAVEVTPIRSVDRIPVGKGSRGPITEKMQTRILRLCRRARRKTATAGFRRCRSCRTGQRLSCERGLRKYRLSGGPLLTAIRQLLCCTLRGAEPGFRSISTDLICFKCARYADGLCEFCV